MNTAVRKRLFNALRIAVSMAALWFVVQGVTWYDRVQPADGSAAVVGTVRDEGDTVTIELPTGVVHTLARTSIASDAEGRPVIRYGLRTTWTHSRRWFLVLAVLLQFPVLIPQAYRFRIMLATQGIRLRYWECLKLSLAGNFLNFAAPLGSNAGDVFKAYFASLHAPTKKPEAVATVILDRAIGLASLVLVVVLITSAAPNGSRLAELKPYMLTMFLVGVFVVVAYFAPWLRRFLLPASLLQRIPMRDQIRRIDSAARTLLRQWPTVVVAILVTIFLQALAMFAYSAVAVAIGLDVDWRTLPEFFAYFYTGTVVQALPGPPQGLGTVELAYRYFFSPFGSPAQIVSMALSIRLVVLVCALPGLWVTLTGTYRPKQVDLLDDPSGSVSPCDAETVLHSGPNTNPTRMNRSTELQACPVPPPSTESRS